MKLSALKTLLTNGWTPALIGLPLAISAFAASEKIWIARPTGAKQCEETNHSTLGASINDLEASQLVVRKAAVGALTDRVQCLACAVCGDGSYNIAEIEATPNAGSTAEAHGWEVVDAKIVRVGQ